MENAFTIGKNKAPNLVSLVEKEIKSVERRYFRLFFEIFSINKRPVEFGAPLADFGETIGKGVAEEGPKKGDKQEFSHPVNFDSSVPVGIVRDHREKVFIFNRNGAVHKIIDEFRGRLVVK